MLNSSQNNMNLNHNFVTPIPTSGKANQILINDYGAAGHH